jgi:hypothetical protein
LEILIASIGSTEQILSDFCPPTNKNEPPTIPNDFALQISDAANSFVESEKGLENTMSLVYFIATLAVGWGDLDY